MQDMQRTPEETADIAPHRPEEGHDYPYGLEIRLTAEDLAKCGLAMPNAGDLIHINAMGTVTNTSACPSQGCDRHQSVSVQITHMDLENEDDEDDADDTASSKLYPTMD